jgi:hypothetical protein
MAFARLFGDSNEDGVRVLVRWLLMSGDLGICYDSRGLDTDMRSNSGRAKKEVSGSIANMMR